MDKDRSQTEQPKREYWHGKTFAFFTNRECEFFPCHAGIDPDEFNCLFCYCPLYALGISVVAGLRIPAESKIAAIALFRTGRTITGT